MDDVTVRFGGVTAVNQVTLRVEEGQRWAVIGPNGAGKTTLFRTVSGEVRPTRGTVRIFGSDMSRAGPHRKAKRGVGRTYQITELFKALTVEDNLTIAYQATKGIKFAFWKPVRLRGEVGDRIDEVLAQVGLVDVRHTIVNEMSHGEQRQLEIAMALACNPRLLLLDEPAAGLSAAERIIMKELVDGLPRDLTIVLIEHDMNIALELVERVLVLDNGRMIAEGPPEEIRDNQQVQDVYLRYE